MTPHPDHDRLQASLRVCEDRGTHPLVRDILSRIGDKWTLLVIQALAAQPLRFGALMDGVPGISHRMLTRTLRALERDGLVSRTSYPQVPPRVDYELTELGRTLLDPVLGLIGWVQQNQPQVERQRAAFDGNEPYDPGARSRRWVRPK